MENVMKDLVIDEALFNQAFARDIDFEDVAPQSAYLNTENGDLVWVYHDNEDAHSEAGIPPERAEAIRQQITASPEQYLEIPGLNHSDHHDILQAFIDSDWTEDEEAKSLARSAYHGSIGWWKTVVDDEHIIHVYYDFRYERTQQMAEEFLREHGINPQWR
jgi:hypothetical protein